MVYIARSSRPRATRSRLGGATAATTLRAGLNQMSEGRPRRSAAASGRRRAARGTVGVGDALLMRSKINRCFTRESFAPTCRAPPDAPPALPCARVSAAGTGHAMTDRRAGRGGVRVHGPASSGWLLVALCAAVGAYCLLRMRSHVVEQRRAAGGE